MQSIPFAFAKAQPQLLKVAKYTKTKEGCALDIVKAATNLVAHLNSSFPPMFLRVLCTGMLATGTSLHIQISVLAINRVAGNKSLRGDVQAVIAIWAAFLKAFLLLPSLYYQSMYVWQAVKDLDALQTLGESSDDHMPLEEANINERVSSNDGLEQTLLKVDFSNGLENLRKDVRRLIFDEVTLLFFATVFIFVIVWAIFKFAALYLCPCSMWNWHLPISGGCVDLSSVGTCSKNLKLLVKEIGTWKN